MKPQSAFQRSLCFASFMTQEPSFDAACAAVPGLLEQDRFHLRPGDIEAFAALSQRGLLAFDVTGIGGSESPARSLVAALLRRGFWAEYRPLSAFLDVASERTSARCSKIVRGLVVVSQGLSPNAQLALGERANYEITVLITAQDSAGEREQTVNRLANGGVIVVSASVPNEPRALARIAGPACLAGAGERFVRELSLALHQDAGPSASLGAAYAGAFERALPLATRCSLGRPLSAIVVTEPLGELIQADLWKWREALGEEPPAVFDAFSFVHGPLQTLPESKGPILIVSRELPAARALKDRLKTCLASDRHTVVEFELASATELAWFEINGLISRFVLVLARERKKDLGAWRGGAADEPIYALDSRRALETP